MDNYLLFESGIDYNRVFAHRGDIFICEGLFKPMSDIEENDHIIAKPNRPVLIISDDIHNADIVKVLPFSTKAGSLDQESITSGRVIKVPGIKSDTNSNYIDVSQIFTINVYQLKYKLGHASQEIVDAAVALHTLQNVANATSINTIVKIFKEKFPNASIFNQLNTITANSYANGQTIFVNNMYDPSVDLFSEVKQVTYEELMAENATKPVLMNPETKEQAYEIYQEWLSMGTDLFRSKYNLTKQQYVTLRDRCVCKMLGKIANFKKHDWSV